MSSNQEQHSDDKRSAAQKEEDSLEDLHPTPMEHRTWTAKNYALMWASMAVNVSTYMLGSSLLSVGLNWWQATLAVFIGSLVVLVMLILNGHSGVKYAISFPVFLRSSFGVRGAQFAALSRGIVGVGWFSFQVWIGATGIYQGLIAIFPDVESTPLLSEWMGINLAQLLCFLVFLVCHIILVIIGLVRAVRLLQLITAPVMFGAGLSVFIWFAIRVGVPDILAATYILPDYREGSFWVAFWPALSAILGSWSTMALNILDFTRYTTSQRQQALGQAVGLPPALTLFCFLGIASTGGGYILFQEQLWNPTDLFGRFQLVWLRIVSCILIVFGTMAVNMTANVVSPANDIANIRPDKISFKMGGIITCVLGVALCPWKLFDDPQSFIFSWLIGYGAILGAVGGVMLCDYYVLRRRSLHVPSLYDYSPHSRYYFTFGVNFCALAAVLLGVSPCVPGFLVHVGAVPPASVSPAFLTLYDFAYLVALACSGVVHFVLMRAVRWAQRRRGGGGDTLATHGAYDTLEDEMQAEAEQHAGVGSASLHELQHQPPEQSQHVGGNVAGERHETDAHSVGVEDAMKEKAPLVAV